MFIVLLLLFLNILNGVGNKNKKKIKKSVNRYIKKEKKKIIGIKMILLLCGIRFNVNSVNFTDNCIRMYTYSTIIIFNTHPA